jgi:Asp/Glu/hydantoin racemase
MAGPRIALIHALRHSPPPAMAAMAAGWPEAEMFNLLDDSLSVDRAKAGAVTPEIIERFLTLGRYAHGAGAAGILFTCSAFASAIAACKAALPIPCVTPNEAAIEAALDMGPRIGLLATFGPTLDSLAEEVRDIARARGIPEPVLVKQAVPAALAALDRGEPKLHDHMVIEAADIVTDVDVLLLAQFSMSPIAPRLKPLEARPVLTTPALAVAKLRRLVGV